MNVNSHLCDLMQSRLAEIIWLELRLSGEQLVLPPNFLFCFGFEQIYEMTSGVVGLIQFFISRYKKLPYRGSFPLSFVLGVLLSDLKQVQRDSFSLIMLFSCFMDDGGLWGTSLVSLTRSISVLRCSTSDSTRFNHRRSCLLLGFLSLLICSWMYCWILSIHLICSLY